MSHVPQRCIVQLEKQIARLIGSIPHLNEEPFPHVRSVEISYRNRQFMLKGAIARLDKLTESWTPDNHGWDTLIDQLDAAHINLCMYNQLLPQAKVRNYNLDAFINDWFYSLSLPENDEVLP